MSIAHQLLARAAFLSFFATSCSGNIDVVNTYHATGGGSSGNSGVAGAGGNIAPAGMGGAGGSSGTSGPTTGPTGTTTTTGAGGQGGGDVTEGGTEPAEAGVDAADDRSADMRDVGIPDAGPPPAIDYSIWQLQLPTGSGTSPTTVPPNQLATFSNIYFYKADDGGQVFMSPATGITTPNSTRCRTELRESNPQDDEAA